MWSVSRFHRGRATVVFQLLGPGLAVLLCAGCSRKAPQTLTIAPPWDRYEDFLAIEFGDYVFVLYRPEGASLFSRLVVTSKIARSWTEPKLPRVVLEPTAPVPVSE